MWQNVYLKTAINRSSLKWNLWELWKILRKTNRLRSILIHVVICVVLNVAIYVGIRVVLNVAIHVVIHVVIRVVLVLLLVVLLVSIIGCRHATLLKDGVQFGCFFKQFFEIFGTAILKNTFKDHSTGFLLLTNSFSDKSNTYNLLYLLIWKRACRIILSIL